MDEKKVITLVTKATGNMVKVAGDLNKSVVGIEATIAKAVLKTTTDLVKVTAELEALALTSADMTDEIVLKQADLDAIAESSAVALRKAKAELDLKVLENELKVLKDILRRNNLAEISTAELDALRTELVDALDIKDDMVSDAVRVATDEITAAYTLAKVQTDAANSIEIAELKANHRSKDEVISSQAKEIVSLKDMIAAQRDAQVQMAEASSKQAGPSFSISK